MPELEFTDASFAPRTRNQHSLSSGQYSACNLFVSKILVSNPCSSNILRIFGEMCLTQLDDSEEFSGLIKKNLPAAYFTDARQLTPQAQAYNHSKDSSRTSYA